MTEEPSATDSSLPSEEEGASARTSDCDNENSNSSAINCESIEPTEEINKGAVDALSSSAQNPTAIDAIADGAARETKAVKAAIENIPATSDEEIAAKLQRKTSKSQLRKQQKRMRILNWADRKDIRYRGFLSYRGLRIIAWIFIIASQAGLLLSVAVKMDPSFAAQFGKLASLLPVFRNYVAPLFLIAAFATILNNSRKFSALLLTYGGFALIFYALFCLIYDRYLVGIMMVLGDASREDAVVMVDGIIALLCQNGYFSFNIFVDLFLCTLFTYFMVYRPQKVFVGKKLIVFRLFAILPVLYEIASIVLKAMATLGTFVMPTHLFPLLTTKPPMTFLIFAALTFFIKKREWLYRRNGKTHEQYQAFLGTNLNSLQFSSFVSIQFVVVAIIDLILSAIISAILIPHFGSGDEAYSLALKAVSAWGFGICAPLILVWPVIMLFSYTRTHKNTMVDLIINLVGIAALVLVYLEGLYQATLYGVDMFNELLEGMLGL